MFIENLKMKLGQLFIGSSLIVETGDFGRFAKGNIYDAFLGLAPGEDSSGPKTTAIARELACFVWGMMTDNISPRYV